MGLLTLGENLRRAWFWRPFTARRAGGGGKKGVLIINDTALPKSGDHSVGGAHQYCGALGKLADCQSLVTLTLADGRIFSPLSM